MSAIANIVINDGAATPVAHTFNPAVEVGTNAKPRWKDKSGGIPIGYPIIDLEVREPNKASKQFRTTINLRLPTLEVTSPSTSSGIQPAPTVAYFNAFQGVFYSPERSTLQERKDLLALVKNLLADAVVTAAVRDNESPW